MASPSYLVCATERSGSTLLCELLSGTGVAGRPEEYFEFLNASGRVRQPREYFEDAADPGILELLPPLEPPLPALPWSERLAAARERGTTPNGVFGAKMMWAYLGDFLAHGEPEEQLGPLRLGPRRAPRHAGAGDLALARRPDRPVARRGPRRRGRARLPRRRDRAPQAPARGARRRLARLVRRARDHAAGDRLRGVRRRSRRRRSARCSTTSACRARASSVPEPPMRRQSDARSQEWVDRFRDEVPA